jgi:hypothetical protein
MRSLSKVQGIEHRLAGGGRENATYTVRHLPSSLLMVLSIGLGKDVVPSVHDSGGMIPPAGFPVTSSGGNARSNLRVRYEQYVGAKMREIGPYFSATSSYHEKEPMSQSCFLCRILVKQTPDMYLKC